MSNQSKPRFGYPTKRVPNPERLRKRGMAYHNDLPQYRMVGDRLEHLHATKGWRRV